MLKREILNKVFPNYSNNIEDFYDKDKPSQDYKTQSYNKLN